MVLNWRLISMLVVLGVGWSALACSATLTFAQANQLALQQNPQMLLSRAKIAEAQGALQQAQGNLLPKLQASYSASGSDGAMNAFGMKLSQGQASFNDFGAAEFNPLVAQTLYTEPDNLNDPGWTDNYQSKLELQIPIFNGGKVYGYLLKAQAYLNAAQHGDALARQQLTFEVLKAYAGVRTAVAFVDVAAKAIQAANSYAELTDKLCVQGVVARNDQLRAQLNLGTVKLQHREAQNYLAKSYDQLQLLVGSELGQQFSVSDNLAISLPTDDLVTLRAQLVQHNPGLRALQEQVAAGSAEVKIAKADYLPHFNLMVSEEWNNPDFELGGQSSTLVAGVVSWDLFDLGVRRGAVDQAYARLNQQTARLSMAQDQLRLQLDAAWRDAELATERVAVCELSIQQAEEAERLELLRYQKGVSTMAELLQIQTQLDQARSDLVAANYQQIMQRAGVLLALGRLTPEAINSVEQLAASNITD
ncbi:MAG: TolC family protein [Desulfuromonas sp.]|nr:TolC family protein [Desulfuromonas sp.]